MPAPALGSLRRRTTAPDSETSTGLSSISSSGRSSSNSPTRSASREPAARSTARRPRPPSSSGVARSERRPRSIRAALAGSGMIATSSRSSVQIPPSPSTSAGTIASRPRRDEQLHSRLRPSARRAPRPGARRPAPPAARTRRGRRLRGRAPSSTPPSSDLCWIDAALSLSAMRPPSSWSAATASSSSMTMRPSTTATPASRSSSLASCSASHRALPPGPAPSGRSAAGAVRRPAVLAGGRGSRARRDLAQSPRVARDGLHRGRAPDPGAQPGRRRDPGLGEPPRGIVVEQFGERRGDDRRHRTRRCAPDDSLANGSPGLLDGPTGARVLVIEHEHLPDRRDPRPGC